MANYLKKNIDLFKKCKTKIVENSYLNSRCWYLFELGM